MKKHFILLALISSLYAGQDIYQSDTHTANQDNHRDGSRGFSSSNRAQTSIVTIVGALASPPLQTTPQQTTPPIHPYKFNQRDGDEASLINGLREIARRAGGTLAVLPYIMTYTDNFGAPLVTKGYYEFKNIKKTITWKICANSTVSTSACTSLPTLSPRNQANYRFRWYRKKERGSDKDGIQVYERQGNYYGAPLRKGYALDDYKMTVLRGRFDNSSLSIPSYVRYYKTDPRHYHAIIK